MRAFRNSIGLWIVCAGLIAIASPCEAAAHHKSKSTHHTKKRTHGKHKSDANASHASESDLGSSPTGSDELDAVAPSPALPERASVEPEPAAADSSLDDAATASAAEDDPAATGGEATDETLARVRLGVAGGTTYRLIEVPAQNGLRRLDTGWVPAVALELRAAFGSVHAWMEFAAHYETSLHTFGSQHATDPSSQLLQTPIRSHRFEIGVMPSLRFGSSEAGLAAGVFLGYGLRAFASVAELQMPRFTEHGPLLRLELDIPIVGNAVRLRIAPEASALVSISRAVRRIGATDGFGFAVGGEASLRVRLAEWLRLALEYRESHVFLQSSRPDPFADIERYVLLGVQLQQ
jgi:hypothetical protein